jgi:ubiquinol-cytochrome c reductase cytochrome c subunit
VTALLARRRSPLATAVVLLLALLAVGGLYAVVSGTGKAQAAPKSASSTVLDQGRQLYLEGCSSCHGANLEGAAQPDGTIAGPTLIGVGAAAVDFQVGTGRMPLANPNAQAPVKPGVYSDVEVAALANYVASVSPGPAIPSPEELDYTGADIALGGNLFRNNCGSCHNFAGEGGALTNGKYAPSMVETTDKHIWEAMLTGPQNMPVFPNSTLPPENKQDLLAYINSLQEQPNAGGIDLGRLGPVTEGLLFWIVGIGALVGAAVWIGVKAR